MKPIITSVLLVAVLTGCTLPTEVINYRTVTDPDKGIMYIVDGVVQNAVLISGVGTEQTRVYITRQTQ